MQCPNTKLENKMRDWAAGIETRNYGIKREIDAHMLSELMRTIAALVLMAGALLFYSWVRSQIISTGYEIQNLSNMEKSELDSQKNLILEEEILSRPDRIDDLARNELNMAPLHPSQLILPPFQNGANAANVLAMADSQAAPLKKSTWVSASGSNRNN
jgi:cell division protein FtsL